MNHDMTTGPSSPARRRWLVAAVAAAAGLGGAGLAWWKYSPREVDAGASEAFWRMNFETPGGTVLAMQALRGRPLLVNFWATWCPPCVEELPLLDRFFKQNSSNGWQVIGLAVDKPEAVRQFLAKSPVSFPVVMAGVGGMSVGKSLGNLAGGLPFTVVLGSDGSVLNRKIGKVSPQDLEAWHRLK